jgi:arylformamidase
MIVQLLINHKTYRANLSSPIDISLPLREGNANPSCYWAEPVKFETISSGDFVGSVKAGGNVNYQKLTVTPHGNGTHTECYGHLSADPLATINQSLSAFHFVAEVISVTPEKLENGDAVINLNQLKGKIKLPATEAVVLRTLPNVDSKKTHQYSGTNPPYLDPAVTAYLEANNIAHLLIDLPSVDREVDGGKLLAHRAFWKEGKETRKHSTITELIFVDNSVADGLYLLNLQITSLEMDASPSKPVLYKLEEVL